MDRAAAQQLTIFLAGWLLAARCMIRIMIRVFQAVEARRPQRPWWEYPLVGRDGQYPPRPDSGTRAALEIIGLLIRFAAILVGAVGY